MSEKFGIFDMDGTLVDSLPYWRQLYREYLASRGITDPPRSIMSQTPSMTAPEAASFFIRSFQLSDTQEEAVAEINRIIGEHYRSHIPLRVGAEEFLQRLEEEGWRMCVASATAPELIDLCLRHLGIRRYFQFALSCVEVGVGKTRPDVYLEAARRLGGAPGQTVVFEDAIIPAATAKQAGFLLASIYNGSPHQDHGELRALSDCYLTTWDYEDFSRQFQRFT